MFLQICIALQYIHSLSIVHGDLKPHNCLLQGPLYDVKLSDFGISHLLSPTLTHIYDQQGTLPYCSPEVLRGKPYNQKTDIWALGCILYEVCTGR